MSVIRTPPLPIWQKRTLATDSIVSDRDPPHSSRSESKILNTLGYLVDRCSMRPQWIVTDWQEFSEHPTIVPVLRARAQKIGVHYCASGKVVPTSVGPDASPRGRWHRLAGHHGCRLDANLAAPCVNCHVIGGDLEHLAERVMQPVGEPIAHDNADSGFPSQPRKRGTARRPWCAADPDLGNSEVLRIGVSIHVSDNRARFAPPARGPAAPVRDGW